MNKLDNIKKWNYDNKFDNIDIPAESIDIIHDLLVDGNFNEPDPKNIVQLLYFGQYYRSLENYENMAKYYSMAIENGYYKMACWLGWHYEEITNYDKMQKYYSIAAENGDATAMNNLGMYYHDIQDYANMMKYYLMAIEKGNHMSMYNLAIYYESKKDDENAIKYYLMLLRDEKITKEIYTDTISNLYYLITDENNRLELHHYIQIIENTNHNTYLKIIKKNKPLLLLYNIYKQKIDLLELPFKYAPGSDGFIDAKNDFVKCVTNIK